MFRRGCFRLLTCYLVVPCIHCGIGTEHVIAVQLLNKLLCCLLQSLHGTIIFLRYKPIINFIKNLSFCPDIQSINQSVIYLDR